MYGLNDEPLYFRGRRYCIGKLCFTGAVGASGPDLMLYTPPSIYSTPSSTPSAPAAPAEPVSSPVPTPPSDSLDSTFRRTQQVSGGASGDVYRESSESVARIGAGMGKGDVGQSKQLLSKEEEARQIQRLENLPHTWAEMVSQDPYVLLRPDAEARLAVLPESERPKITYPVNDSELALLKQQAAKYGTSEDEKIVQTVMNIMQSDWSPSATMPSDLLNLPKTYGELAVIKLGILNNSPNNTWTLSTGQKVTLPKSEYVNQAILDNTTYTYRQMGESEIPRSKTEPSTGVFSPNPNAFGLWTPLSDEARYDSRIVDALDKSKYQSALNIVDKLSEPWGARPSGAGGGGGGAVGSSGTMGSGGITIPGVTVNVAPTTGVVTVSSQGQERVTGVADTGTAFLTTQSMKEAAKQAGYGLLSAEDVKNVYDKAEQLQKWQAELPTAKNKVEIQRNIDEAQSYLSKVVKANTPLTPTLLVDAVESSIRNKSNPAQELANDGLTRAAEQAGGREIKDGVWETRTSTAKYMDALQEFLKGVQGIEREAPFKQKVFSDAQQVAQDNDEANAVDKGNRPTDPVKIMESWRYTKEAAQLRDSKGNNLTGEALSRVIEGWGKQRTAEGGSPITYVQYVPVGQTIENGVVKLVYDWRSVDENNKPYEYGVIQRPIWWDMSTGKILVTSKDWRPDRKLQNWQTFDEFAEAVARGEIATPNRILDAKAKKLESILKSAEWNKYLNDWNGFLKNPVKGDEPITDIPVSDLNIADFGYRYGAYYVDDKGIVDYKGIVKASERYEDSLNIDQPLDWVYILSGSSYKPEPVPVTEAQPERYVSTGTTETKFEPSEKIETKPSGVVSVDIAPKVFETSALTQESDGRIYKAKIVITVTKDKITETRYDDKGNIDIGGSYESPLAADTNSIPFQSLVRTIGLDSANKVVSDMQQAATTPSVITQEVRATTIPMLVGEGQGRKVVEQRGDKVRAIVFDANGIILFDNTYSADSDQGKFNIGFAKEQARLGLAKVNITSVQVTAPTKTERVETENVEPSSWFAGGLPKVLALPYLEGEISGDSSINIHDVGMDIVNGKTIISWKTDKPTLGIVQGCYDGGCGNWRDTELSTDHKIEVDISEYSPEQLATLHLTAITSTTGDGLKDTSIQWMPINKNVTLSAETVISSIPDMSMGSVKSVITTKEEPKFKGRELTSDENTAKGILWIKVDDNGIATAMDINRTVIYTVYPDGRMEGHDLHGGNRVCTNTECSIKHAKAIEDIKSAVKSAGMDINNYKPSVVVAAIPTISKVEGVKPTEFVITPTAIKAGITPKDIVNNMVTQAYVTDNKDWRTKVLDIVNKYTDKGILNIEKAYQEITRAKLPIAAPIIQPKIVSTPDETRRYFYWGVTLKPTMDETLFEVAKREMTTDYNEAKRRQSLAEYEPSDEAGKKLKATLAPQDQFTDYDRKVIENWESPKLFKSSTQWIGQDPMNYYGLAIEMGKQQVIVNKAKQVDALRKAGKLDEIPPMPTPYTSLATRLEPIISTTKSEYEKSLAIINANKLDSSKPVPTERDYTIVSTVEKYRGDDKLRTPNFYSVYEALKGGPWAIGVEGEVGGGLKLRVGQVTSERPEVPISEYYIPQPIVETSRQPMSNYLDVLFGRTTPQGWAGRYEMRAKPEISMRASELIKLGPFEGQVHLVKPKIPELSLEEKWIGMIPVLTMDSVKTWLPSETNKEAYTKQKAYFESQGYVLPLGSIFGGYDNQGKATFVSKVDFAKLSPDNKNVLLTEGISGLNAKMSVDSWNGGIVWGVIQEKYGSNPFKWAQDLRDTGVKPDEIRGLLATVNWKEPDTIDNVMKTIPKENEVTDSEWAKMWFNILAPGDQFVPNRVEFIEYATKHPEDPRANVLFKGVPSVLPLTYEAASDIDQKAPWSDQVMQIKLAEVKSLYKYGEKVQEGIGAEGNRVIQSVLAPGAWAMAGANGGFWDSEFRVGAEKNISPITFYVDPNTGEKKAEWLMDGKPIDTTFETNAIKTISDFAPREKFAGGVKGIDEWYQKVRPDWYDYTGSFNPDYAIGVVKGSVWVVSELWQMVSGMLGVLPLTILKVGREATAGDINHAAETIVTSGGGMVLMPGAWLGEKVSDIGRGNIPKFVGESVGMGLSLVFAPEALAKGLNRGFNVSQLAIKAAKGDIISARAIANYPEVVAIRTPQSFRVLETELSAIFSDKVKVDKILEKSNPIEQRKEIRALLNPETAKVFDAIVELVDLVGGYTVNPSSIRKVNFDDILRVPIGADKAIKSVLDNYKGKFEIHGSFADWVQMKNVPDAYRPKDLDAFFNDDVSINTVAKKISDDINKELGKNITRAEGAQIKTLKDGNWDKMLDIHHKSEFSSVAPLGFEQIRNNVVVDGIEFEPLGNQLWHRGWELMNPGVGTQRGLMGPVAAAKEWRLKDQYRFEVLVRSIINDLKTNGEVELANQVSTNLNTFLTSPRGEAFKWSPTEMADISSDFLELFKELQEASILSGKKMVAFDEKGILVREPTPSEQVIPGTLYHVTFDIRPYLEAQKRGKPVTIGQIMDETGKLTKAEGQFLFTSPQAAFDFIQRLGEVGENAGVIAIRTTLNEVGLGRDITPAFRIEQFTEPKEFSIEIGGKKFVPGGDVIVGRTLNEWLVQPGTKIYMTGEKIGTYHPRSLKGYDIHWAQTAGARDLGLKMPNNAQIHAMNLMAMKETFRDLLNPTLVKQIKVISGPTPAIGEGSIISFRREPIYFKSVNELSGDLKLVSDLLKKNKTYNKATEEIVRRVCEEYGFDYHEGLGTEKFGTGLQGMFSPLEGKITLTDQFMQDPRSLITIIHELTHNKMDKLIDSNPRYRKGMDNLLKDVSVYIKSRYGVSVPLEVVDTFVHEIATINHVKRLSGFNDIDYHLYNIKVLDDVINKMTNGTRVLSPDDMLALVNMAESYERTLPIKHGINYEYLHKAMVNDAKNKRSQVLSQAEVNETIAIGKEMRGEYSSPLSLIPSLIKERISSTESKLRNDTDSIAIKLSKEVENSKTQIEADNKLNQIVDDELVKFKREIGEENFDNIAKSRDFERTYYVNLDKVFKSSIKPRTITVSETPSKSSIIPSVTSVPVSEVVTTKMVGSEPIIETMPISETIAEKTITEGITTPITTSKTVPVTTGTITPTIPITTPITPIITTTTKITTIPITTPVAIPVITTKTAPSQIIKLQKVRQILKKGDKEGLIAWKQGWNYRVLFAPWSQNDVLNTRKPVEGVEYHEGVRSAYDSIVRRGGYIPPVITRDMGIYTIQIRTPKDQRKPELVFRRDVKDVYKGKKKPVAKMPRIIRF